MFNLVVNFAFEIMCTLRSFVLLIPFYLLVKDKNYVIKSSEFYFLARNIVVHELLGYFDFTRDRNEA